MKTIVFDVCDTLFYSNTTFDFIKFVLYRKNKLNYLVFLLVNSKLSPFFYPIYFLQKFIYKSDLFKKFSLKLLVGYSKEELENSGNDFFHQFLKHRKITQTHHLLDMAKTNGEDIYLVSASLEPVVSAIAENYNLKYFSSSLDYQDNLFTGYLIEDLSGIKGEKLNDHINLVAEDLTVVTDNLSDQKLMKLAGERFVIVYNNRDKTLWKDLNPNFIELYS